MDYALRIKILAVIYFEGLSQTLAENGAREAEALTWKVAARKVDNIVREVAKV